MKERAPHGKIPLAMGREQRYIAVRMAFFELFFNRKSCKCETCRIFQK